MKILIKDSEAMLYEKVKSLRDQPHSSWKCVHFSHAGTYTPALRQRWLDGMFSALGNDDDGYVYLCGDGDIFILFQGPLKQVLGQLARHSGGLAETHAIFDLGAHWQPFYHLCKSKLNHSVLLHNDMPPLFSHRSARRAVEGAVN